MASILRQIVAGPRLKHPEAGLDLCYVTDEIIATSGPSSTYPKRAYRYPTHALVRFLDAKHGANWAIWEFRAEGTGYPDDEVYGRIHHFPWPDHHPPPFAVIPPMMASMRNWLRRDGGGQNVAVVHCKAGKGRSGTVACSYLISEQGWGAHDALNRFTERRMRVGFGPGVSIPSQLRWVEYVDRWTNQLDKRYVERPVEIVEVHVWGLRDGLKVEIGGYVDDGRKIKRFHRFHRNERTVVSGEGTQTPTPTPSSADEDKDQDVTALKEGGDDEMKAEATATDVGRISSSGTKSSGPIGSSALTPPEPISRTVAAASFSNSSFAPTTANSSTEVILRPRKRVILPTSDVNVDFERRAAASYTSWTVVTSIAHVWFNAYFEGGDAHDSGVFEAEWDQLDGIKGSHSKGTRAVDRIKVVWRYPSAPPPSGEREEVAEQGAGEPAFAGRVVSEPAIGEAVQESSAADWRGEDVVVQNDNEGSPFGAEAPAAGKNESDGKNVHRTPSSQLSPGVSSSSRGSLSMTAGKTGERRQSAAPQTDVSLVNVAGSIDAGRGKDPTIIADSSSGTNSDNDAASATQAART